MEYRRGALTPIIIYKNIDEVQPGRDIIEYKAFSGLRFLLTSFQLPELCPSTGEKGE